jgi:hypothetical protein
MQQDHKTVISLSAASYTAELAEALADGLVPAVAALAAQHPAWAVMARQAGTAPPSWHARPQNNGGGPWVIEAGSAEALGKLLAEIG